MTLNVAEVLINGKRFPDWTELEITRSLHELAGSIRLTYDDQARMQHALPRAEERHDMLDIVELMPIEVKIDDELVLRGFIESVEWEVTGDQVRASLTAYDPGADLMEGSANPQGPAEYRGLTVTDILRKLVAPFGLTVRAETDVGAPIKELAIDVGESVLSVMDKACQLRAVRPVSDGIGAIVLTTSGTKRAPAPLLLPGNILSYGTRRNARERFSDYWVKGQSRQGRRGTAPLTPGGPASAGRLPEGTATSAHSRRPVSATGGEGTAYPLGAGPPLTTRSAANQRAIVGGVGHAQDPAVTRYRPRVWVARTQAGGAPNQVLAEWRLRIARGRAVQDRVTVAGWRAGDDDRLWRPNELVQVRIGEANDPYDMLIDGVTFCQADGRGTTTQLSVVGREAYDLEPLPDEHHGRHRRARGADVSRGATGGRR